jgi:hypothetical protein
LAQHCCSSTCCCSSAVCVRWSCVGNKLWLCRFWWPGELNEGVRMRSYCRRFLVVVRPQGSTQGFNSHASAPSGQPESAALLTTSWLTCRPAPPALRLPLVPPTPARQQPSNVAPLLNCCCKPLEKICWCCCGTACWVAVLRPVRAQAGLAAKRQQWQRVSRLVVRGA